MSSKVIVDKNKLRNSNLLKGYEPTPGFDRSGEPFTGGCIICCFADAIQDGFKHTNHRIMDLYRNFNRYCKNGEYLELRSLLQKYEDILINEYIHDDPPKDWAENFINSLIAELEENDLVEWTPVKEHVTATSP